MKIKETIERECCQDSDLVLYHGLISAGCSKVIHNPRFCRHCGQTWYRDSEMGPAGSNETVRVKAMLYTP